MKKPLLSDLSFVRNEYDKLISEAKKYAEEDRRTKKQYVLWLKEKATKLFELQGWNLHGLASYIKNDLDKIEFDISEPWYYTLFTEDEKLARTNPALSILSHRHEFGSDGKCLCSARLIDGLPYTIEVVDDEPIISDSTIKPESEPDDPYSNPVTEFLQRSSLNLKELASLADDLVKKYYENPEFAKEIESALDNPKQLVKQSKDDTARIMSLEKKLDLRQRVGEWEKLKALLLEKCQFNIAKVAKILTPLCVRCGHSGITPKHMSANIMKKEQPEIMKHLDWFRSITISLGNKKFTFDIADWYNRQIQRGKLELPFEEIVLETARLD